MAWRTSFVGREGELDRVRALINRTRLLTLTGPGGIGKTRLAMEVARREAAAGGRDVVVVELASVRDRDQFLPAVATALDLRDTGAVDLAAAIAERLEERATLLVLDNLEHLLAAAPTIANILDAAPSATAIVTSRVVLGLSGEQEYVVPPLELPGRDVGGAEQLVTIEAIALFVDRARAVHAGFELTDRNAATVVEICRRLDGLPLAIELAASRLKLLTPEALLGRLGERLAVLRGGATDAPARQRTLRATIAWSHDLLAQRERRVFRRSGVFVGGFGLDAAAAVTSEEDPNELFQALELLVDHSLLAVTTGADDEPRFSMLETIREFAIGELEPAEADEARARHAAFGISLAEGAERNLRGPEHGVWLARVTEDLDNLRAALAWTGTTGDVESMGRLAASLATYWRYYGDLREGRRWLAEVMVVESRLSSNVRARVLRAAGWLEAIAGNLVEGDALLRRSLRLFERAGDAEEIGVTLYHLGATAIDAGRLSPARRWLLRGLSLARQQQDPALEARHLVALASVAGERGRRAERIRLSEGAIEAARVAGDRQRLALAVGERAWAAWDAGDRQAAIKGWTESVRLLRAFGEQAFLGSVLLILGYGKREPSDLEESRALTLEGVRLNREVGAMPDIVAALSHAADWFLRAGAPDLALAHWRAADTIRAKHGFVPYQVWPLGDVLAELERLRPGLAGGDGAAAETVSADAALDAAISDLSAANISEVDSGQAAMASQHELTPREREVLALVAAGRSNAEIGEMLYISRKTASVHVANIKDKLGADSRIGIVTTALQRGLVARAKGSG